MTATATRTLKSHALCPGCGGLMKPGRSACYHCRPRSCAICHRAPRQSGGYCLACQQLLALLASLHHPVGAFCMAPHRDLEDRIARYRARAEAGLPLFEEVSPC